MGCNTIHVMHFKTLRIAIRTPTDLDRARFDMEGRLRRIRWSQWTLWWVPNHGKLTHTHRNAVELMSCISLVKFLTNNSQAFPGIGDNSRLGFTAGGLWSYRSSCFRVDQIPSDWNFDLRSWRINVYIRELVDYLLAANVCGADGEDQVQFVSDSSPLIGPRLWQLQTIRKAFHFIWIGWKPVRTVSDELAPIKSSKCESARQELVHRCKICVVSNSCGSINHFNSVNLSHSARYESVTV